MSQSKDNLEVGSIAHDIRQMLMVITGRAGILLEGECSPNTRRHLLAMEMAATDASAMLSRWDGRAMGHDQTMAALVGQTVDDCFDLILPPNGAWSLSQHPDQVRWAAFLDIPPQLKVGLPAQILREVLNNLLINALAVLPEGGQVRLTGTCGDGRVILTFQDSGPGVSSDVAERLFDPGFTTSGKKGKGLGLAGCRLLLEDFGGHLVLKSSPGEGAIFELNLPQANEIALARAQAVAEIEPAETGKVLVVDDDPAVGDMLAEVLAELGWKATVMTSGDDALAHYQPGNYDVALVDQSLPGISGLDFASQVRARDLEIVLVLVTGWGNEDIVARAGEFGFDQAEEKPLTVGKIRHILSMAAALRQQRGNAKDELR